MRTIRMVLAIMILVAPVAAGAAELPLAPVHKAHRLHRHHRHVVYRPQVHFGYYWYRWGWRSGGTARSWYGSSFAFLPGW